MQPSVRRQRAQAAAKHGIEAHALLSLARELRRAARTAAMLGLHDLDADLMKKVEALDSRRRRVMKKPPRSLL